MRVTDKYVSYFKNNDGFTRLIEGMYDLYMRYERCYGAVRLLRPTPEEEKAISDFFKRDYYNQALIRIGLADFERQMQKVLSSELTLETLLEMFFDRQIAKRPTPRVNNAFSVFVEKELMPRYRGTEAENWLQEVATHVRRLYRAWTDRFNAEPTKIEDMLVAVCNALNDLPCDHQPGCLQTERLTDFALRLTGDAHKLDISGECGPLFLRALVKKFDASYPATPEESGALYYRAGLLTAGVLNTVVVRGLMAYCGEAPDEVTVAYNRRNEAHVLTLENIDRFTALRAYGDKVFIMENAAVFSAVSEHLSDVSCTLLCAGNGTSPALIRLLDLLCAADTAGATGATSATGATGAAGAAGAANATDPVSVPGATLYYSGDMDYAGLSLADRLYLSYPKHFKPWRYDKKDYERIVSDSDFILPENKKETGLYHDDLAAVLSLMRKRGKTAPQSALIPDLVQDIRDWMC